MRFYYSIIKNNKNTQSVNGIVLIIFYDVIVIHKLIIRDRSDLPFFRLMYGRSGVDLFPSDS